MAKPELCERCKQVMSEVWFHKKDEFEDVNICLSCYENEYGPFETDDDYSFIADDEDE